MRTTLLALLVAASASGDQIASVGAYVSGVAIPLRDREPLNRSDFKG